MAFLTILGPARNPPRRFRLFEPFSRLLDLRPVATGCDRSAPQNAPSRSPLRVGSVRISSLRRVRVRGRSHRRVSLRTDLGESVRDRSTA